MAAMSIFRSQPIAEHAEVPLADDGAWERLVERWSLRASNNEPGRDEVGRESFIVSVADERDPLVRAARLAEIVSLVESQGDRVVGREICHVPEPNPRMLLGKGRARDIADRARAAGATMLVLDAELSPSQARNLEDATGIAVCDREAVILNVFVRHARTRRARIQVEIAQLEYLRPRIRGVGLDMDQQIGGTTRARGPGETASELLARKLDSRLEQLRKRLRKLATSGQTQRRGRDACKRIALVGYTNAGKTSLMNALTGARLSARDMPFETLDTTSRCLTRHGGHVLLSDTVGFIRRLPDRLLDSFASTLSEIVEANLLVVVVDASDHERDPHLRTTLEIIERIGAKRVPRFYVLSKIDRLASPLDEAELQQWLAAIDGGSGDASRWAALSVHDPNAVRDLEERLLSAVRGDEEELTTFIPYAATRVLGLVYRRCRVVGSIAMSDGLTLAVRGPAGVIAEVRAALASTTEVVR